MYVHFCGTHQYQYHRNLRRCDDGNEFDVIIYLDFGCCRNFVHLCPQQMTFIMKNYSQDVLYEDCHYHKTNTIDIVSPFIKLDGEPLKVVVPSVEDILGDKLTAFAPETTGIPYYKNDKLTTLEIIKQLYDVGRLFDRMQDIGTVSQSFKAIADVELGYRNLGHDLSQIYDDIRQTALNISTRGFVDKDIHTHGFFSVTDFQS